MHFKCLIKNNNTQIIEILIAQKNVTVQILQ